MTKKKLSIVKKVDFKKPKQIKEKNHTLDRGTDGKFIKDLNYYFNICPDRYVTTDDAAILLNGQISKSSLEKFRSMNRDDK